MRRTLKFISSLILALVAVGITFTLLFFISPSWQKHIFQKAAERDEGRQWSVESIQIMPTRIEVEGLQVLEGKMGAVIDAARLNGPFWTAPFRNLLIVDGGVVSGAFVDLTALDVGDLTSRDWKIFISGIRDDRAFWTERINILLSKLEASGIPVVVHGLEVQGNVLLPGEEQVPVRWLIEEADSRDLSKTLIAPGRIPSGAEL